MPELPEVETVRLGLESLIDGATIDSVEVRRESCVRLMPGGAGEFAEAVAGMSFAAVARRGKYLWLPLEDAAALDDNRPPHPVVAMSAHLGMSGQFRVHEGEAPSPHPHCRARFALTRRRERVTLDFLDQRTFGYLHAEPLVPTPDGGPGGAGSDLRALPRTVAHVARDALDPALDERAAASSLRRGSRAIKAVLLDQTVVSGVGNIYADEALWRARIHPARPAHAVSAAAARTLLAEVRAVMSDALAQGGTSFDALYVNVNGESGYFDRSLDAYGRAGAPCGRCGAAIARDVQGGRSTHWCPRCQRRYSPRAGT